MKTTTRVEGLTIGGEPRVNLLPFEVRRERKARVVRRRLGVAVIGVFAVVAAAVGASTALAVQAQGRLAEEQARTGVLIAQQSQFLEVRRVQDQLDLVRAAQKVGGSTEINWKSYLDAVQETLPDSVTIDTVNIDSASPFALYAQPTAPLQGARVATVSFTAKSAVLPDVPTWLSALATLPGYADALPGSVVLEDQDGVSTYMVNITMHVNDAAYSQRFAAKGK